ncbi:MAG TPA: maleylpyruvate isomerase family mycothiol-dependent enzyme [Actinomycetes bacterium]
MDPAALDELAAAEERLLLAVSALDDGRSRAPSRLPGWSRGHLVTHLARNADGMRNLVAWASTGVVTPMYASIESRAAGIDAGSGRPAAELVPDLAEAASRLASTLAAMPAAAEDAVVEIGPSRTPTRGAELALLRLREVEIHHVDLDLGYEPADWSEGFVVRTLDQLAPRFRTAAQMPLAHLRDGATGRTWAVSEPGTTDGELVGPATLLLAWLTGRTAPDAAEAAGLVRTGGGPVPSPAAWL